MSGRRVLRAPLGRVGWLAAVLSVAWLCVSAAWGAEGSGVPKGEHGAAKMEFQLQELAKLMPQADVTQAPARVDPVIWQTFVPKDNEMTAPRVALGRKLYFETRLSRDGTAACATCHDVTRGFTDQLRVSEGISAGTKKQLGQRNAPTVLNAALLDIFFLDGRSPSLDHQAKQPIVNAIEMGMPDGEAAAKAISGDAEYQKAFQEAYGRPVNYDDIGRAIAAFERTLMFLDSPFRRFLEGDANAISAQARAGWDLFNGRARCNACHHMNLSNPLGTDDRFHNVGVSARHQDFESLVARALKALQSDPSEKKLDELALSTPMSELGRFMVTKNRSDIGAFRTSMILNVGITPPYMHDGSLPTLWDVMDHYNKGGEANLFLDGGMEPLALTEAEIDQVVALLFSMTDVRFAAENQHQLAAQKAAAAVSRKFRDNDIAFRRKFGFEDRIAGAQSTSK